MFGFYHKQLDECRDALCKAEAEYYIRGYNQRDGERTRKRWRELNTTPFHRCSMPCTQLPNGVHF